MAIHITTNLNDIISRQKARLEALTDEKRIFGTAASNMHAQIASRIQQKGELTDGGKIGGGKYSKGYEKQRKKKGRQTAHVDMTMTGDMMDRSFSHAPHGRGQYVLGFSSRKEYDKMKWNERRFGVFIQPNRAEINLSLKDVVKNVQNVLKNPNR